MKKGLTGICLVFLLPLLCAAQDRSKKAYELIYDDIQVLKKQLMILEDKLNRSADEIRLLKDQVRELQSQIRVLQADQANVREGIKNIPSQYQFLLDKLDQMNQILGRISEDLLVLKGSSPQPVGPAQAAADVQKLPAEKRAQEATKETPPTEQKPLPPTSSLSPQETYNTAYADYLRGNFDLAVEGFKVYRETFPDSPLADNALYWIGECSYSQRKFEEAVDRFSDLILNYPQGDKIAAAYLKKGLALAELGRKEEAMTSLKLLIGKYPLEEEARIAQEKIKELVLK